MELFFIFTILLDYILASTGASEGEQFAEKYFKNDYSKHHMIKISIRNVDDLNLLKLWRKQYKHLGIQFWDDSLPTFLTAKKRDFLVTAHPVSSRELLVLLTDARMPFTVLSTDLRRLIQWEKSFVSDAFSQRTYPGGSPYEAMGRYQLHRRILAPGQTLSAYLDLKSVYDFIELLTLRYPLMASSFDLGTSFEGRPIRGIKIGARYETLTDEDYGEPRLSATAPAKPAILLDGTMQGRDWFSVPALLYLAQQLLAKYQVNEDHRMLLDVYDWYIIPVVNPDGYNYTWTHDRFWKKTRSYSISNSSEETTQCRGVDLSRNFASDWGETDDPETELFEACGPSFAGDKPFSERESSALAKFLYNHRKDIKIYGSVQGFGQNILLPFAGHVDQSGDYNDQMLAAGVAAVAMQRTYGEDYEVGQFSELLYSAGGSSLDWAYETARIKYSYQFQLRDRSHWGYLMPRNQIIPAAKEFFSGITELARFVHFYELSMESR